MIESFEDVMDFARKISNCEFGEHPNDLIREWCEIHDCGTCTVCLNRLLDHLQEAHEHEIEHLRKAEFHRGYVAGQKSMDAEHRAVAMRLQALPLDEDSHGNLSQIARAIWHSDFGWTRGACEALRDELVRLLGGVHDGDDSGEDFRRRGACTHCDCGGNEQPSLVAYDVLGNERHKAVCELRKLRDCKEDYFAPELFFDGLYDALGCRAETDGDSGDQMCDRLIHLLGGDEPTAIDYIKRIVREHDIKCLDMELSGAELSQASVDAMSSRADEKYIEYEGDSLTIRDGLGGELKLVNGDILLNGKSFIYALMDDTDEHDKSTEAVGRRADQSHESSPTSLESETRITDELRKSLREIAEHMGVPHDRDLTDYSDEAVIDAIYWRIDNYYQINIDELQAQVIKYCKQRDKAREKAIDYRNLHHVMQRRLELERDEAERQCKDLQERLGRSRAEYCETCEEAKTTDILRAKLDAVREALDG